MNTKTKKINQDFKFVKELGRGSSGICYKAVVRTNPSVHRCIKRIKKQSLQNNDELPKEVYMLDQLAHPDIIRLYDVYQDQSSFYLVTDLCEDGDLFDYLDNNGALSQHEAKKIFTQILSAVKYCHGKKIVHRDLKPQNFLIIKKGQDVEYPKLKLIDFDLSFQWYNNCSEQILSKQGKRIIGTPYYIAPEILSGKYDQRCDIWSLGVILFILVTGSPPFGGSSPKQIFRQIQKMDIDYEIPQMDEISLLLKDLLIKMLSPIDKRIILQQIFAHPWMRIDAKKSKLKVDYNSMIQYSKFSKLKQMAANYLAMQMTTKELKQHQQLFRQLDQNNDGFLSVQELRNGLSQQSQYKSSELAILLEFVEVDNNGLMNYNDFLASFVNEKATKCKKNLRYVFDKIDANSDGVLSRQELDAALKRHGMKKKALKAKDMNEDSNKIFSDTDKNHDGIIDFQQFASTICNQVQL